MLVTLFGWAVGGARLRIPAVCSWLTELFLGTSAVPVPAQDKQRKGSAPRTPTFRLREWASYQLAATLLTHFPIFPEPALCYFRLLF